MNEKRGRWVSLDAIFRQHESEAAQWLSERDRRLAQKTKDEPDGDDRRRREQAEQPREDPT